MKNTIESTSPMELVFVRHGQSESNVVQKSEREQRKHPLEDLVYSRHDSEQRLSHKGVRQALVARQWMIDNGMQPEDYDERYMSSFYRSMETAILLGGNASWLHDSMLIERDWGVYGALPKEKRSKVYALTERMKQLHPFFARFDNGQSIFDKTFHIREFRDRMEREMVDRRVLAVCHGETMWAARFVIERLRPDEWVALDRDKTLRIGNCCILQYCRQNPEDPEEISRTLSGSWRRMINPLDPDNSPYDGAWVKLRGKQRLSPDEVRKIIDASPRLIPPETD